MRYFCACSVFKQNGKLQHHFTILSLVYCHFIILYYSKQILVTLNNYAEDYDKFNKKKLHG